jgi:hypothetical protein
MSDMTTTTGSGKYTNDSWRSLTITAIGAVLAATAIVAVWIALGMLLVGS